MSAKDALLEAAKVVGAVVVVFGALYSVGKPVIAQVVEERVQSRVEKLQDELLTLTTQQALMGLTQSHIKEALSDLLRRQEALDGDTDEILRLLQTLVGE